jgi:hypothetical protein
VKEAKVAIVRKVLFGIGGVAVGAMIAFGIHSGPAATAYPGPTDPGLPTIYTNPSTYIVNGDGTRSGCVATQYGLSC